MEDQGCGTWERRLLDALLRANDGATQGIGALHRRRRRPAETNASPLDARNLEAHLCTLERHVAELRERWERLR